MKVKPQVFVIPSRLGTFANDDQGEAATFRRILIATIAGCVLGFRMFACRRVPTRTSPAQILVADMVPNDGVLAVSLPSQACLFVKLSCAIAVRAEHGRGTRLAEVMTDTNPPGLHSTSSNMGAPVLLHIG